MGEDVKILCVDDEPNVLKSLIRLFMDEDYEVLTAESGEDGLKELEDNQDVQVVISDYRMPGMNGVDFLKQVCEKYPDTVRIVLSGYADTAAVVDAINEGQIYKFIPKPWNDDELKVTIAKAAEVYFLRRENSALNEMLQRSNEELTILNENLEKAVFARTQEIIFQNKVLAKSQFILDSLPVGVIGIDGQGMIVQHNQKAVELCCPQKAPLIGLDAKDKLPAELNAVLDNLASQSSTRTQLAAGQKNLEVIGTLMEGEEGQEGKILVIFPG